MEKKFNLIEVDKATIQKEKIFIELFGEYVSYNIFNVTDDGVLCDDLETIIKFEALEIIT